MASGQEYGPDEVRRDIAMNLAVVDFGDDRNSVDEVWREKAEEILGYEFSPSYKWFLRSYGGGEISGEEIYSLYGIDFEFAVAGDIIYQHLLGLRSGTTLPQHLVVSATDFGEIFYFDYDRAAHGECPLSLRIGSSKPTHYATNFYEFLCKRIRAHLP